MHRINFIIMPVEHPCKEVIAKLRGDESFH